MPNTDIILVYQNANRSLDNQNISKRKSFIRQSKYVACPH